MTEPRPHPRCPICKRPVFAVVGAPDNRPFCSARCKEVDLHRWFGEAYRVPGDAAAEGDDQLERPPSRD